MDTRYEGLEAVAPPSALLGYLNFSEGKPDPRFQKQLADAYDFLASRGAAEPWAVLADLLRDKLTALAAGGGAFRDTTQAAAVLDLAFRKTPAAYRRHHADLLFHLGEAELFQPFFLARVVEAVLAQGAPWSEEERIVSGALAQLNDYVGHRPVAILETRPRGEPYEHERLRPIPLYLRGAGVAPGRYHDLVNRALDVLRGTDASLLADTYFDPDLLDELALDPRAYDHGHPVNKRPNYAFGEWDPHHLDNQGRYRRFVVRAVTLEALLDRVEHPGSHDRGELLFEAAAVLAGTMLMASGVSGAGPASHDSLTTLTTLSKRIPRYRDAFYQGLLDRVPGEHGARLHQELAELRQPFGGARQHVNQYLARHRAAQLQQRHLALLFAEMGYPEASRRQAGQIPAASIRMLSEIQLRLAQGQRQAGRGELDAAAGLLSEVEDLLHRGIAAGALVDPWNVLGFQGLFPLFHSQEDSVRDPRVDELTAVLSHLFQLYDRVLSEAAGAGRQDLVQRLTPDLRRLAAWWDRFGTVEVSDVRHVHGGEAAASAEHVATALARWHDRGAASADLAFWREHQESFRSPKAFARVVDALLRKHDYRAAMALLMTWLGQAEQVPLDEEGESFHDLALRWMLGVTGDGGPPDAAALVPKFFDYLEANAEEYWQVPALDLLAPPHEADAEEDDEGSLFGAAYDDVTYEDSTDDREGAVADGRGELTAEFDLEREAGRLEKRLRFLSTVARLWQVAAQRTSKGAGPPAGGPGTAELGAWLGAARSNQRRLLALLDAVHACPVPAPLGSHDSLVEYDRRRVVKEQLLYHAIATCLDTFLAVGTLEGGLEKALPGPGAKEPPDDAAFPAWGPLVSRLEQTLLRGEVAEARLILPEFLRLFREEPLLYTALADGGNPRQILRVRLAQSVLRALVICLPKLGLLRETYHLLRTARAMEQAHPTQGRGITQFNELFQAAYQAVIEAVVDAAGGWGADPRPKVAALTGPGRRPPQPAVGPEGETLPTASDHELTALLERVTGPFLKLWFEHSRTMQLSALEAVRGANEWREVRAFIQRYGGDLFDVKFLALGNLRGVLHNGVGSYLDYLRDRADREQSIRLVEELDREVPRERAVNLLQGIILALIENYEEYKDYNNTTSQSDYGENLYTLLDFLRLKASYERHAWNLRPLALAHEMLVRKPRLGAAALWYQALAKLSRDNAEQHLAELGRLEQAHGIRLQSLAVRLGERFVKPLDLDRLCALVGPAMEEADRPERPSFHRLQEELKSYTATPTAAGTDVPPWLRRVEQEVHRFRATRSAIALLAENLFRVPRRPLTHEELEQQLQEWDKPI